MSTTVFRVDPDTDRYVVWESIVQAPVFAGTYEETLVYLSESADKWLTVRVEDMWALMERICDGESVDDLIEPFSGATS